jgi:hypothetical protein
MEGIMRTIIIILITPLLCSCSLNVANGMLAYESGDTQVGAAKHSIVNTKTGEKESRYILNTRGAVNLTDRGVSDEKIIKIYEIRKASPDTFDRDYLASLDMTRLEKILKAIEKPK